MSDEAAGEKTCPLCAEEMDLTDQQLKPCKCGYEMCVWCWHQIMDMAEIKDKSAGLCPACRSPYDKEGILGNMAAKCETRLKSQKKNKNKKKAKANKSTEKDTSASNSSGKPTVKNVSSNTGNVARGTLSTEKPAALDVGGPSVNDTDGQSSTSYDQMISEDQSESQTRGMPELEDIISFDNQQLKDPQVKIRRSKFMAQWRNVLKVVWMILKWLVTLMLVRSNFFLYEHVPHTVIASVAAFIIPCCNYVYRVVNRARTESSSSSQNAFRVLACQLPEMLHNMWKSITMATSVGILTTFFPKGLLTIVALCNMVGFCAWQYYLFYLGSKSEGYEVANSGNDSPFHDSPNKNTKAEGKPKKKKNKDKDKKNKK